MRCAHCSAEVPAGSSSCPACGASFAGSYLATQSRGAAGEEASPPPRPSSAARAAPRFVAGDVLGERFRVIGLLGRGGMGEVYHAEDLRLEQEVSLKLLPEHLAGDPDALARLHREVRLARQVAHPNVCRVYDIFEADGVSFLAMEYVSGEDLASVLRRFGRLPADKALQIARQLCAGLAAAHHRGVVHRDLKPANIMIDGDGDVRVTDFGLAAVASAEGEGTGGSGTPAYMAPEQLAGRSVTARTDIYALGLVLYEVFTGKPAFSAVTMAELLRARQSNPTPTTPTLLVPDLDPVIERAVLRCLEADPARRPASPLHVAAALPGGDPLALALAAGETPSPEMVAAAPSAGSLRPLHAGFLMGLAVVCAALVVMGSARIKIQNLVGLDKPPAVLAERAREILATVRVDTAPADVATGFWTDWHSLEYVRDHDVSPARWAGLEHGSPAALYFWYRQSPQPLVPFSGHNVTPTDPPAVVAGLATVLVDTVGHLARLTVVPPGVEHGVVPTSSPDWSALFAAAGLDLAHFHPVTPSWLPPQYADTRFAWASGGADRTAHEVRVEAASYHGRPTWFRVVRPWETPSRDQPFESGGAIVVFVTVLLIVVVGGGGWLAWRNLRAGRGDRRGADRLALFVLMVGLTSAAVVTHHVPSIGGELLLVIVQVSSVVFLTVTIWALYLALEPFVRARWPHRLIAWSRVMAGDLRDPLVGRDALIGATAGAAMALVSTLRRLAPPWFGLPPDIPQTLAGTAVFGLRGSLADVASATQTALIFGLGTVFVLLLLTGVVRRTRLAEVGCWLLLTVLFSMGSHPLQVVVPCAAIGSALLLGVTLRLGLLAVTVMVFVEILLVVSPLTTHLGAWYAAPTWTVLAVIAGLLLYAARTALGGRPLAGITLAPG